MLEDPLIGRQLGNFRIERLLGRGGMAQVYYGWDVNLHRPVAIKIIDARYRDSPAYAARFVREARAVATWRHENIVQIHHAGEEEGLYYFVMEYIEGMDLAHLMDEYAASGELMPHADVLRLGRAVASALDYAHQRGVIHRDVKPSNVLVDADGRVVLTDFGLALDVRRGSIGEAFGTPHYIAPEQARSSAEAVPQSDLYSLGVMLYEMLTGVVPFDDPSSTSVVIQHITQPPPPPRQANPDLSQQTEAVLIKALSKSPQERYQSGAGLLDALEATLQAGPVPAPAPELPPPPAGVAPRARRSLSRVSIVDRVASHLEASAPPAPGRDHSTGREDDLVGKQLDEYRLEALLGQGGMARVYRGLDVRLNRYVAIKVIDTPFRTDSDYLMRFEREAQAIACLEHPHIVRLYRYGKVGDLLYMAMQYVDGADMEWILASYRADGEFIETEEARRIVREICEALDYAHRQGVIHRDVKPANIMLNQDGQAILTDFGLALLASAGTRGAIFGSPHYISPEQAISSANVMPQSDLYAVGVIMYEMFTGQLPFDAESPLDIAMMHMTESPRPPRELRPDISPELETVILKAMAREPRERYASGKQLAAALDRALKVRPSPAPARPSRPSIPQRVEARRTEAPLPALPAVAPGPARVAAEGGPARRRWVLYAGIGAGLCMLLAILSAAAFFLATRFKGVQQTSTAGVALVATTEPARVPSDTPMATAVLTTQLPAETPAATNPVASPLSPASGEVKGTAPPPATPPTSVPMIAPSPTPPPPTATPTATASPTLPPTATPVPEPQLPDDYELLIATEKEQSLFLVNRSENAIPLKLLRLTSKKGGVDGADWGVDRLRPDECVVVWKDEGEPKPPKDLECNQVGTPQFRGKKEIFWEENFSIYLGEQEIGKCKKNPKECTISSGKD